MSAHDPSIERLTDVVERLTALERAVNQMAADRLLEARLVDRLERAVNQMAAAEEDRLARERERGRRRRRSGCFDERPSMDASADEKAPSMDASADEKTPSMDAFADAAIVHGRDPSESGSGGSVVALKIDPDRSGSIDRSIDPIDLILKIDPEIDPEVASAVASAIKAEIVVCRDRTTCPAELDRYRRLHPKLDVDFCFVDLTIRIVSRPELAPRTAFSAPAWLHSAMDNAARSAGVLSAPLPPPAQPAPAEPPATAEAAEPIALRETPPPVFDLSPLAERLRGLQKKEGLCPTSSTSDDRGSVSG